MLGTVSEEHSGTMSNVASAQ